MRPRRRGAGGKRGVSRRNEGEDEGKAYVDEGDGAHHVAVRVSKRDPRVRRVSRGEDVAHEVSRLRSAKINQFCFSIERFEARGERKGLARRTDIPPNISHAILVISVATSSSLSSMTKFETSTIA